MKFHYVVSYDETTKKWEVPNNQFDFFLHGSVWDEEVKWMFIPDEHSEPEKLDYYYINRLDDIVKAENEVAESLHEMSIEFQVDERGIIQT